MSCVLCPVFMTTIASINCLRFGLIYYCLAFLRCTFEMIIRSKDVLLKLEARDQPSVFSNGSACNRLQCFNVKHHLSSFQHGYLLYSLRPRFSVLTNLKARVDHWSMDEKKKNFDGIFPSSESTKAAFEAYIFVKWTSSCLVDVMFFIDYERHSC